MGKAKEGSGSGGGTRRTLDQVWSVLILSEQWLALDLGLESLTALHRLMGTVAVVGLAGRARDDFQANRLQ